MIKNNEKKLKMKVNERNKLSSCGITLKQALKPKKLNLLKILQENYNIDLNDYSLNNKIKKYSTNTSRNKTKINESFNYNKPKTNTYKTKEKRLSLKNLLLFPYKNNHNRQKEYLRKYSAKTNSNINSNSYSKTFGYYLKDNNNEKENIKKKKDINNESKEKNICKKLEDIKSRCDNILQIFYNQTNILNKELNQYKIINNLTCNKFNNKRSDI